MISSYDVYLFRQGRHNRISDKLGAHPSSAGGEAGTVFAVWAPNATAVSVIGDFNRWDAAADPLALRPDGSGIWEGFVPGVGKGALYKYHVASPGYRAEKGDPYALFWEIPPRTASIVWDTAYDWKDDTWMRTRGERHAPAEPLSIYEVHLGSWRRETTEPYLSLSYRELAEPLADYAVDMGFTHVEFMPVMEHPFYASWGYQTVGYYAPTSRYGTPQEFMHLIDHLHRRGIGVILDWVPSHFPLDDYGLAFFDGTHLYEHAHQIRGLHPEWTCNTFNHGRHEVRSFLISNALFWLEKYHADGLRVDAVSSMLYLDYARPAGTWLPNEQGGRENLESIAFLRRLTETVREHHPDTLVIAEEATAWPHVTGSVGSGGLGFSAKWNMGWMHDTLQYLALDPVHRQRHHNLLTFSIWYAFSERFILPLSHDEVVHGKSSLIGKMHGDRWQRFANLRLLFGYMFTHPGKKLLFMGGEIGQWSEWSHDTGIEWHLLDYAPHQGIRRYVQDVNRLYRSEPALHERDFSPEGFAWVDCCDTERSVIAYLRKGEDPEETLLVVCNFTPVPRYAYRVGVPAPGAWREVLNSDATEYGGSGVGNLGCVETDPVPFHGYPDSLPLTLPPLATLIFKHA
ncbi:1,4-alpha-glucan branching protein GlgB [Methanoculleus sp. FWC-SCC1]|uniref:1,4-alpha-glucan branching enzyme n=1 Tax=Methanoculleus frigidifontis TaxID=2584085 RepID=A0ABT8ME59_9EURY|nr:1,4-alpha-glucan branching protein GlgB [Methanoculleus sp. FWC-SCC1]MDN7026227.1 1,4-alpha-glucan branching protein GlgB [Methanoculleus sp. FWC-SCC1]